MIKINNLNPYQNLNTRQTAVKNAQNTAAATSHNPATQVAFKGRINHHTVFDFYKIMFGFADKTSKLDYAVFRSLVKQMQGYKKLKADLPNGDSVELSRTLNAPFSRIFSFFHHSGKARVLNDIGIVENPLLKQAGIWEALYDKAKFQQVTRNNVKVGSKTVNISFEYPVGFEEGHLHKGIARALTDEYMHILLNPKEYNAKISRYNPEKK